MRRPFPIALEDSTGYKGGITVRFTYEWTIDDRPMYAATVRDVAGKVVDTITYNGACRSEADTEEAAVNALGFITAGIESRRRGDPSSESWDLISDKLWNWIDQNNLEEVIAAVEVELSGPDQSRGGPEQSRGAEL